MKKYVQLSLFTFKKNKAMRYVDNQSQAVISQDSWDHLHPNFQKQFEPVEAAVTHKINNDGTGLLPLDETEEEIIFETEPAADGKEEKPRRKRR